MNIKSFYFMSFVVFSTFNLNVWSVCSAQLQIDRDISTIRESKLASYTNELASSFVFNIQYNIGYKDISDINNITSIEKENIFMKTIKDVSNYVNSIKGNMSSIISLETLSLEILYDEYIFRMTTDDISLMQYMIQEETDMNIENIAIRKIIT